MNVMIDTNVIIDFLGRREPFFENARQIMTLVGNKKVNAYLTASSITDIYYLTRKATGSHIEAKEAIRKLMLGYGVATVDKNDCLKALDTDLSDYEDSLLSICAVKVKATYIITRDIKHFANSRVQAITPDKFVKL